MGAWGQFWSLVWKNYVIRKRHPSFVVLEVVWPVLMFVALALFRLGFPPDHRETCQFQERALPSAGMIPFLQTSICQLQNNCSNQAWKEERETAQANFQQLIGGVTPILEKESTVQAFKALPKMNKVLKALQNFSKETSLDEIDEALKLKNMFKDPARVIDIIANKYGILSPKMAEYLLESTLNPVAIMEMLGSLDMKKVVCDPAELTKYLLLSPKVNKYSLSDQLCRINDALISNITNELVRQLDVAKVIKLGQDLMKATGSLDVAMLLGDIANLVERFLDDSSILSMFMQSQAIPDLSALPLALHSVSKLLPLLMNIQGNELESVRKMIDVVSPLLDLILPDKTMAAELQKLMKGLTDILNTDGIQDSNPLDVLKDLIPALLNSSKLLSNLTDSINMPLLQDIFSTEHIQMMEELVNGSEWTTVLDLFMKNVPNLMNLIEAPEMVSNIVNEIASQYFATFKAVMEGLSQNSTEMDPDAVAKSLADGMTNLEQTLREAMGDNMTDMVMALGSMLMDMVDDSSAFYEKLTLDLKASVSSRPEVATALNKLAAMDTTVTYTFLSNMVAMDTVYSVLKGQTTMQDVCIQSLEGTVASPADMAAICNPAATQAVNVVLYDGRMVQLEEKMTAYMVQMDSIMAGSIPLEMQNGSMKAMYERASNMVTDMMSSSSWSTMAEWMDIFQTAGTMKDVLVTSSDLQWTWSKVEQGYVYHNRIMLPIQMTLEAMENSSLWRMIRPSMEVALATIDTLVLRLKHVQGVEARDRMISRLATYLPYLPQVAISALDYNITQITKLTSHLNDTDKIFKMLCTDADWDNLSISVTVDRAQLREFVCDLDYQMIVDDIWRVIDPMGFAADMELTLNTYLDTGVNWTRNSVAMSYVLDTALMKNNVLDLVWKIVNIDWNVIATYLGTAENMVEELISKNILSEMASGSHDIAAMFANIDSMFGEMPIWNRVKHYVYTWELFADMMLEYAHIIDDGNFTIVEYVEGISPTLGEYFANATVIVPGLISRLETSLMNPQEMVQRILSVDFMTLCSNPASFGRMLGIEPTPDFVGWQRGLCALNWTQILQELDDSNSVVKKFIKQFNIISTSSTADLPLLSHMNWTHVVMVTEKFISVASSTAFLSGLANFPDLGIENFNTTGTNLMEALQNAWKLDVDKLSSSVKQLIDLFYSMSPANDSMWDMWRSTVAQQFYLQYKIMSFATHHLDIINRTGVFDLRAHIVNSPELDKLLAMLEKSSDVSAVIFHNARLALEDNTRMLKLFMLNQSDICYGLVDWLLLPADVLITRADIAEVVCVFDYNTIGNEIMNGFEGLNDLINDIMSLGNMTINDMAVNYTQFARVYEKFTELTTSLSSKTITLGTSWSESQIQEIMDDLQNFTVTMAERNQTGVVPGSLDSLESMDPVSKRVLATLDLFLNYMVARMKKLQGNLTIEGISNDSGDILRLYDALMKLKHGAESETINVTVDYGKVYEVAANSSLLQEQCAAGTLTVYLSVGGVASNMTEAVEQLVCFSYDTFPTVLEDQIQMQYFQQQIARIWNETNTNLEVNVTGLNSNIETFVRLFVELIQIPPDGQNLISNFLNWDIIMKFFVDNMANPDLYMLLGGVTDKVSDQFGFGPLTKKITAAIQPLINKIANGDAMDILLNPSMLQDMIREILSANELLNMLQDVTFQSETILNQFVCEYTEVPSWFSIHVPGADPSHIINLCWQPVTMWGEQLQNLYTNETIRQQIQQMFDAYVDKKRSENLAMLNTTLSSILDGLESNNITSWVDSSSSAENMINTALEQNFNNIMNLLKMLEGTSMLEEIHRALTTVVAVQGHIDMLMEKLAGDEHIPLVNVLPSLDAISHLIGKLNSDSATDFFTVAAVYPQQFYELVVSKTWKETVCDFERFNRTFYFENTMDAQEYQKDLCEAADKDEQYMLEIFKFVEVEKIVNQIESIYKSSANFTLEMLQKSSALMSKLIERVTGLANVNITGMDSWLQTIIMSLERLNTQQQSSLVDSCTLIWQSLEGTAVFTDMVKPYLTSSKAFVNISQATMDLIMDLETNVCDGQNRTISNIISILSETAITQQIKQLYEMMTGKTSVADFTCQDMSMYYSFGEKFVQNIMGVLNGSGANTMECVADIWTTAQTLLADTNNLFAVSGELFKLLENPDLKKILTEVFGSEQGLALLRSALDLVSQQEQAVAALQSLLETNITNMETVLNNLFSTASNVLQPIVKSLFNGVDLKNMTAEEVIAKVCEEDQDWALLLGNLTQMDIRKAMCGNDTKEARDTASMLLNYVETLQVLQDIQNFNSTAFWMKVTQDVATLLQNFNGLSNLVSLVEKLGKIDIMNLLDNKELLRTIQKILTDDGPDAILKDLKTFLDNFKLLGEDSNITNIILNDIRYLANGLFAFSSLRSIMLSNVKVRDLLKQPAEFERYMMDQLNLTADVASAIVDGSISFEMLLEVANADLKGLICNTTEFEQLLRFNNESREHAAAISQSFCHLDSHTIQGILDDILQELDIGNLVEKMVTSGLDSILDKAGVTVEEMKEALVSIVNGQKDLTNMNERFNAFASANAEAFESLAAAQTSTQEFDSLSSIMCGTSLPVIPDEFNVGEALDKDHKELTEQQTAEMESLAPLGPSCQDMYVRIIKEDNGPIVWAYLKPLLRGKILYTPDIPEVRAILNKANATFAKLENFTQIALDWADGTIVLEELAGDTGKDIQALFKSELVKSLVMQISGVNNQDLTNLIYTFQDADTGLMKSISKVASLVSDYVSCIELNRYVGYATESDMQTAAIQFNNRNELLAGLVFEVSGELKRLKRHTHPISTHIQYKIRIDVDNSPNTNRIKDRMWRPQPEDHFFNELRYFRGFIQLQDMIDSAIISLYAEHEQVDFKMPRVATNQFPFPCHTLDTFVNTIAGYLLPVLMTISFIASIAVAVYNLVYDRERGQEETLNIMGLKCGLNFWAWLLTTYLIMAAVCGIDIIILKYANIFTESNAFIVWLYFIDFAFSILMLCYFVSAFFTRTSLAILTCFIVYFISYLPFVVLYTLEVDMTFWQKTLACLSSTTAFSYAAQYIARFEEQMIGLQWSNVVKDPYNTEDDFNFRWCNIMMVIDSGIYFILGWYVRNVMPGKFGVSEPWYFFCLPSRWCCSKSSGRESAYSPSNQGQNVFSEPAQKSTPVVLSARGLTKTYSDGTRAVSDLNLDIHSGNITTLLGHNGAAKTTTMNMLTGMLEPSSGSVRLLNRPLSDMRGSIGLCSQGNALYEYMTVKEHMQFYSAIKDSYNAISKEEEIRQLLKDVDLYHCRHTLVRNLSGGMQRRLSIALAFVGGSKAVILDEPTSGVDPSGRRAIWNLIVRRKDAKDSGGAAILLSTHHLDEADVVSDQIAILHEGRLLCQGSPMFLKQHLASGHRLTITSTKQDPDPVPILSLINRWIPGSKLQQMTGSDMTFVVPASTAAATNFDQFFQEMESRKYELDIESFGISDPQLQEVFLKVCAAADAGHIIQPETLRQMDSQSEEDKSSTDGEWKHDFEANGSSSREHLNKMTVHSSSRLSLIFALLTKRFLHYIRNWKLLVAVLLLPLLLFLLACGLYLVKPTETESPSIILSPAMYGPGAYSFNKQRSLPQTGLDGLDIVHTFMQKPGYSTSCINASFAEKLGSPYECVDPDTSYHNTSYQHMTCKCDDNKYSCAATNNNASIPEFRSATGDILVDLVNHKNISQYLLETFEQFITKRFGGFEFSDGTDDNNMPVLDAKIWYNNKGYHAMPSFYNAYSNGLLRALMARAGKQSEQYGISTYNHPFVFGNQKLSKQSMLFAAADIGIALIILIAFTFVPIGCLLYLVTEFLSREKHMQFIAGVGSFVYWISSFIWDMMIMGISIGIAAIIILIFKPASFWDRENLGAVCVLLALFGSSTITLCYCFSKRFSSSGAAFFTLFCFLNFIGIITIIVIFALNWWRAFSEEAAEGYRICHYVFLIFPPYALASGFMDLIENQVRTTIYERFDYDAYNRPFTLEMIGWNLIAMGIETFVFFVLTIVMDLKCCCGSNSRQRYLGMNGPADEDVDVSAEKVRIDRGDCRHDVVVVRNLHKVYKSGKTELQAVNGLSFGVPANQCFGLLGINGAGKTTTFKILTGCINASDGFTSVLGSRILPGSSSVGRMVGYCPQEDALDSYLSVESMLHFHCKLKGIPASKRTEEVTSVMERLQLTPIKGKLVRACSGGMKRKLSLAIALLGSPPVILLDEPTTGMDPKAKKLVWDCLFRAKHQGQAIILTSHSLEECDILCDRIGIMVNGEFKCLGSSQHLKQKFGNGYTVTLYVSGLSTIGTRIYELIHNHFPSASIRSHHVNVIQLDIPRESVSVAEMFSVLEREKNNYNIEYYTVSQTTLETIFLNIAGEQTDGANLDVSDTNSSSGATGSDISSKMAPMGVSNPFYEHVKKPITLADTGMGPNGSNAHSPFVLPVKDKLNFKDEDGEIFITRL